MHDQGLRVLMISLDKALLEDGPVRARVLGQNAGLGRLTILVFARQVYDREPAPNVRIVSTASAHKLFYVWDAGRRFWSWRKQKLDVVVTQDPVETALAGWLASKIFKAALAVQDHGYFFHGDYYRKESFLNCFRYWFARWVVKRADAVRVVSLRTERALIGLGVAKEKMVRFPVTVPSTKYLVPSTKYLVPSTQNIETDSRVAVAGDFSLGTRDYDYFVLAARFVPIKRLDIAIHAFSLIASKHPDVKLLIAGSRDKLGTGGGIPRLRSGQAWDPSTALGTGVGRKVREFGMESRVEILPWTDDLRGQYQGAIATLITSDREGYNMTAVESLICGTPVIMTDVGCAGEVVQDGINGYVVPVGDVDALADRMERALQDPHGLRDKIKEFKWQEPEAGMADLYRTALSGQLNGYGIT